MPLALAQGIAPKLISLKRKDLAYVNNCSASTLIDLGMTWHLQPEGHEFWRLRKEEWRKGNFV